VAPSIVNDPQRISRGLVVIVFALLIFIYGIRFFLKKKEAIFKQLFIGIIVLLSIEFSIFWVDYFGNYQKRSYAYFNLDIGGALESALRSTKLRDVGTIYLDDQIPFVTYYWDFYQRKLDTYPEKVKYFDFSKEDFTKYIPGSLFVVRSQNAPNTKETKIGDFERIEVIREPDGRESFYVFYRTR
jgi:hypothetical protein